MIKTLKTQYQAKNKTPYKSGQRVPELRFKEFDQEWTKSSIKKETIVNPRTSALPNKFIYIDLESVTKGMLVKEEEITLSEAPSRAQRVLSKNDILYQTVRPYQKNNYYFSKDGDYVASTGYAQIKARGDSKYLYQFLHTTPFVNVVNRWSTGTSYPAISPSELVKIPIAFPTLLEQQKIAAFLSAVDEKVQQLTKKKALLEQYKKGVMQQLFSQKIRFTPSLEDFKDELAQGMVIDLAANYPDWNWVGGNKLFDNISDKNHNSDLPILAITQDQGAIPREMIDYQMTVTEKSISSYKVVQVGDFVISLRTFQGGIEYSNYHGICSPAYIILRPNSDDVDRTFYKFYLKTSYYIKQLQKNLEGIRDGKMISYIYFSEIKLPFPSLSEQQKISNFLLAIDAKIEGVNQQIEKTQTFKKGLLQQMFV